MLISVFILVTLFIYIEVDAGVSLRWVHCGLLVKASLLQVLSQPSLYNNRCTFFGEFYHLSPFLAFDPLVEIMVGAGLVTLYLRLGALHLLPTLSTEVDCWKRRFFLFGRFVFLVGFSFLWFLFFKLYWRISRRMRSKFFHGPFLWCYRAHFLFATGITRDGCFHFHAGIFLLFGKGEIRY